LKPLGEPGGVITVAITVYVMVTGL